MVLMLESSCVNLAVLGNDYCACCCYMLSIIVDFMITWYILFPILSWPMISTQYPCFVLTPTFMFSSSYLWSAANVPSSSTQP